MALVHWLLIGHLAPAAATSAWRHWLGAARDAAARDGLTGALLFDGERWLTLLEGEPQLVAKLVATLPAMDEAGPPHGPRRTAATVGRAFIHWRSGYVDPSAIDVVVQALDAGIGHAVVAVRAALDTADTL
jgi:hypothetical protein